MNEIDKLKLAGEVLWKLAENFSLPLIGIVVAVVAYAAYAIFFAPRGKNS